ncbi:MAG TPA: TIGR03790 family protein [Kiritimatiellia bacterium]|nr:TIGR03790 family protein [Kiritimatiellia bacterium]
MTNRAESSRQPLLVLYVIAILLIAITVGAQSPREVLLLANSRSPVSLRIAQEYANLRGIPEENRVNLSLPDTILEPESQISPEDFMRFIWEPAQTAIRERGLQSQILAWVYSVDFPIRVTTDPPMSLMGMTFVRGHVPDSDVISKGSVISPFFAGPDKPNGPAAEGQPLSWFHDILKDRMPLPSMMLGFTGSRGNDVDSILRCLHSGVESDGTRPTGTVFFVTSDDVRSRCRAWQYPAAAAELQSLGVGARITDQFSNAERSILGFMMGGASVNPLYGANAYLPGCMAEHLTSAAGIFHISDQTKLTAWIFGGASATAGTVTEPMAIWTKFPAARFYVHQARGCSILESFFLSIRCPLQILLIGDPLARPFAEHPAPAASANAEPLPSNFPVNVPPDAQSFVLADDGNTSISGGRLTPTNEWIFFSPANEMDTVVFTHTNYAPQMISVELAVNPGRWDFLQKQVLGLVFDVREDGTFKFFGLQGELSAWMFAEGSGEELHRMVARGALIRPERGYGIMVRRTDAGLEGLVDGLVVCSWPEADLGPGRWGILAGGPGGYFRNIRVLEPAPPSTP